MRSIVIGLALSVLLPIGASGLQAADSSAYEVLGIKPGMTVGQIEAAFREQNLGSFKIVRAPSFEQLVALARREPVKSSAYDGVQTLRAENNSVSVQVFFVAMPQGPTAAKITTQIFSRADVNKIADKLTAKYGSPGEKTERVWVWGDTASFYARTRAYLEFRPSPASATVRQPVAIMVLGDPSLEKASRQAIDTASRGPGLNSGL